MFMGYMTIRIGRNAGHHHKATNGFWSGARGKMITLLRRSDIGRRSLRNQVVMLRIEVACPAAELKGKPRLKSRVVAIGIQVPAGAPGGPDGASHPLLHLCSQLDPSPEGAGLASGLHRNSAYRKWRAALASRSDVSGDVAPGRTDKTPVLIQSCRRSSVLSATLRAPIKSAWRV